MMTTFGQLLEQARVELDPTGLHLAKEYRTCEAVSRLFVAIRATIDSHSQVESKSEAELAALAKRNRQLAAELSSLRRKG